MPLTCPFCRASSLEERPSTFGWLVRGLGLDREFFCFECTRHFQAKYKRRSEKFTGIELMPAIGHKRVDLP